MLSDGAAVYTPGVSQRRGGATTHDLPDRLGTSIRQTNVWSNTLATRSYGAFGTLVASTGTPVGPFGFAGAHGYQEDGDSGLKLLGHRYCDPSTGRFLTRDPIQDGRNWYAYCDGNPLKRVDPTGLVAPIIYLGAIAIMAILASETAEAPTHPGDHHDPADSGQQKLDQIAFVIDVVEIASGIKTPKPRPGGAGLGHGPRPGHGPGHGMAPGGNGSRPGKLPDLTNPGTVSNGQRGLPKEGPPNSSGARIKDGELKQVRVYGDDGNAVVDIDWGHNRGFGDPHFHKWPGGVRDDGNSF